MEKIIFSMVVILCAYGMIGTGHKVDEIKGMAQKEIPEKGWKILRYEGYQWGSFAKHGGKVWYYVQDMENPEINYRIQVALWSGELQYYYGEPERLERLQVNLTGGL